MQRNGENDLIGSFSNIEDEIKNSLQNSFVTIDEAIEASTPPSHTEPSKSTPVPRKKPELKLKKTSSNPETRRKPQKQEKFSIEGFEEDDFAKSEENEIEKTAVINFKPARYSAAKLAVVHISRFMEDKNLKWIGVTRSAEYLPTQTQNISDGIMFYTFVDKAGNYVHAFYPTNDAGERGTARTTDTIDLDHALAVFAATFGNKKDGKKHQLIIPVATMRKLKRLGIETSREHWLELYIEFNGNKSEATLTDSESTPIISSYDETYIYSAVEKNLKLKVKSVYLGQQLDTVSCGAYFHLNSQCSYERKPKNKKQKISAESWTKDENTYLDRPRKNSEEIEKLIKDDEKSEAPKELQGIATRDLQIIPYNANHRFVAPSTEIVDQVVSLTSIPLSRNYSDSKSKDNLPSEFGRGGISIQHLTSAIRSYELWSDTYLKLYTDEITRNDPVWIEWLANNGHMDGNIGGMLIVELQKLYAGNFHLSNYQLPISKSETNAKIQDNAQCSIWRDKDTVYFVANIKYGQVTVTRDEQDEDGNAFELEKIGDGSRVVASFDIFAKAVKTDKGIVTTIEYANFNSYDPELSKLVKKIADAKGFKIVPSVEAQANKIETQKQQTLAREHLNDRLRELISELNLDDKTQQKFSANPTMYITEITGMYEEKLRFEREIKQRKQEEQALENLRQAEALQRLVDLQLEAINMVAKVTLKKEEQSQFEIKIKECKTEDSINALKAEIKKFADYKQSVLAEQLKRIKRFLTKEDYQAYTNDLLKYQRQIADLYTLKFDELMDILTKLKLDPEILACYLRDPWADYDEIHKLKALEDDLLEKINALHHLSEKAELCKNPIRHKQKIEAEFFIQKAHDSVKLISTRVMRLNVYVNACKDATHQVKFGLFSSAMVNEKQLANEHFQYFTEIVEDRMKKLEKQILTLKELSQKALHGIISNCLIDIILTAKAHLLTVHEKGSALTADSYTALLMQYIQELEIDVRNYNTSESLNALRGSFDGQLQPAVALTKEDLTAIRKELDVYIDNNVVSISKLN